ncbi:MAG: hypothetical protein OEV93_03895, partial [Candidatus Moranbacteria bacterium]|nr:hypothetical protein [Candidatus Moranbacteria bacterium]
MKRKNIKGDKDKTNAIGRCESSKNNKLTVNPKNKEHTKAIFSFSIRYLTKKYGEKTDKNTMGIIRVIFIPNINE